MSKLSEKINHLINIGAAIEYYNFVIYGMMINYINEIFFTETTTVSSILSALSIFATGYFGRFIGGIISGIIGDIYGRRRIFILLTISMSISTLIIGLLPKSYYIVILLIICRIIQGMSFAGDLITSITIVKESSIKKSSGLKISFVLSSATLGAIMATCTLYILTNFFDHSNIIKFLWRIPFLIGGTAGIIFSLFCINFIKDEIFSNNHKTTFSSLIYNFRRYKKKITLGIIITLFPSSLIIINLYFPSFLNYSLGIKISEIHEATLVGLIFSCFILPIMGKISDIISKKKMMITSCIIYAIFNSYLFDLLLIKHNKLSLTIYMMLHQLFIASYLVCYFNTLYKLFPNTMKYTSLAFCYNASYTFTGFIPLILTKFLQYHNSSYILPYIMSFICVTSLTGILYINKFSATCEN